MYIGVLPACVCVRVLDLGVIDSCQLPCACWELSPGSLEEQSVLLTAEPSLPSPQMLLLNKSEFQPGLVAHIFNFGV